MKKFIKKLWTAGFSSEFSEYKECKKILKNECKFIYKNPLFILGFLGFIFVFTIFGFSARNIILLVFFTISINFMVQAHLNYYYNYVNRERKK